MDACIYESRDKHGQRVPICFTITTTGCWECTSHKPHPRLNYPRVERNGYRDYLHRHIYRTFNGRIPEGNVVRHSCDNPICINPEHLLVGTQADNMRDMTERMRRAQGETFTNSKLTDEKVRDIKYSKERGKDMAAKYNISPSVVSMIRSGKAWTHI